MGDKVDPEKLREAWEKALNFQYGEEYSVVIKVSMKDEEDDEK